MTSSVTCYDVIVEKICKCSKVVEIKMRQNPHFYTTNVDTVTLSVLLSHIAINLIADLHARNVRGKLQVHIIHLLKYAKY